LKALVELLPGLTAQISSAGTEVIRLQQKAEAIGLEAEKLNQDKARFNYSTGNITEKEQFASSGQTKLV